MTILKVTGNIMVLVDDVLLEQTCLEVPNTVAGFPVALQAIFAALRHADIQAYQRQLAKCNHTLEYVSSEAVRRTDAPEIIHYMVEFKVRMCKAHEQDCK